MLRYTTDSGLVVLYDIRPGNGAGQFLQPRSSHGAPLTMSVKTQSYTRRYHFQWRWATHNPAFTANNTNNRFEFL